MLWSGPSTTDMEIEVVRIVPDGFVPHYSRALGMIADSVKGNTSAHGAARETAHPIAHPQACFWCLK